MTLREKIAELSGARGSAGLWLLIKLGFHVFVLKHFPNVFAGGNKRLGIPALSFSDGPRGIVVGRATCFPVAIARAASWDPELEERVGVALGVEARWYRANYFAGLCVNILRHPAWGRAQECYGEDPVLTAAMGIGLMRGVKSKNLMVCAKHFALNSIENSRFYVDVKVDEKTLHEVYLPQFRKLVAEGLDSAMSAYNRVNGEYCGHNRSLLTCILRDRWGFKGFVSSDWMWGIYDTKKGIDAGMDVEMPRARFYGNALRRAVKKGHVSEATIDRSVERVVRTKLAWLDREEPVSKQAEPDWQAHRELARSVAESSIVLLENRGLLPIPPGSVSTIAVIGKLAKKANLGDHGSSRVKTRSVSTILQGLADIYEPDTHVDFDDGSNVPRAARIAGRNDRVVLAVGYGPRDEGENLVSNREAPAAAPTNTHNDSKKRQSDSGRKQVRQGGDRVSLSLTPEDEALIGAVCGANPNTVVVLVAGSAVVVESWSALPGAIVQCFYSGMEGGAAIANILSGAVNPSAKFPFSVPREPEHLPDFDPVAPVAHYGTLHGYCYLESRNTEPAYAFGFGMSYSSFSVIDTGVVLAADSRTFAAETTVTNQGPAYGATVVQVYAAAKVSGERNPRRLVGFKKVLLEVGESRRISVSVRADELKRYDPSTASWVFEAADYEIGIGTSSRDADLDFIPIRIDAPPTGSSRGEITAEPGP